MKNDLKQRVYDANMMLVEYNLVTFTWGNVSEEEDGIIAIKPSGVEYSNLKPQDIVLVDLQGNIVDGNLNPSSDLHTHLEIYRNFEGVHGVTHTHSQWATSFAQAGKCIPALGTTHADYFYGEIPCTRNLSEEEIKNDYELNTGRVIIETFKGKNAKQVGGVLVKRHGPFAWGKNGVDSVHNAVVLEQLAKMAFVVNTLNGEMKPMPQVLLDKHYLRKHGTNAYYGQKSK